MQIKSEQQDGKTNLTQDLVIHFPDGIPAFEDAQNFSLAGNEDMEPFVMLLSLDVEDLGFFCINPFQLDENYSFKLNSEVQKALKLTDPNDVLVLSFVTRAEKPQDFTANLLAPIVINVKNHLAKQVILEKYPVRLNIWDAIEKIEARQDGEA